jgi:hypothetical protein
MDKHAKRMNENLTWKRHEILLVHNRILFGGHLNFAVREPK